MKKRILSILLILCMIFSLVPSYVSADNSVQMRTQQKALSNVQKAGRFRYASGGDHDYEAAYYYDDAYFSADSYIYNGSLATMTLCLAMSAFGSNDEKSYELKSKNVSDLLQQTGFENFKTNEWFTQKPTKDSIAAAAASKKIEVNNNDYTLIAVAIRGSGYESEWASNCTVGETGQHQGFDEAKSMVLSFIKDYIHEQGISGSIKLWITGYSRAAAVTNLVAGAVDGGERFENCQLNPWDMYVYSFETPAGAVAEDASENPVYKNIFSIVNFNDPVPKVAPSSLGFRRYGIDKNLPTAETNKDYAELQSRMLDKYYTLDSTGAYIVDNFAMKKITINFGVTNTPPFISVTPAIVDDADNKESQGVYLDDLITKLIKEQIKTRTNYVANYQDGMREIMGVLNVTTDEQWDNFKKIFEAKLKSNAVWLIVSAIPVGALIVGNTAQLIEKYAVESLHEAGISNYDADQINKLAVTLASAITGFVLNHPNLTATLFSNINGIASAHYAELCLAWLESMDKNYTPDAVQSFSSGTYRVMRVNSDADIEVYDASGRLAAAIKSDKPQTVPGSSIISSINEDGEKLIYLPAEGSYNLKFTARDSCKMSYSVSEYSLGTGEITRLINYNDISVNKGDILKAKAPAYNKYQIAGGAKNGSSAEYSLLNQSSRLVASETDLKGSNAENAYYMVSVTSDNDKCGYVTGQGIRQLGNYAKLTAAPFEGYKFDGWYINGQKVSSEAVYRFPVKSDVTITAKWGTVTENSKVPEIEN